MAKSIQITREVLEDTGMRCIGHYNVYNDTLSMDRRRLARELRRVKRRATALFHMPSQPNMTLRGRNKAAWWVMLRQLCRVYGVRI